MCINEWAEAHRENAIGFNTHKYSKGLGWKACSKLLPLCQFSQKKVKVIVIEFGERESKKDDLPLVGDHNVG